VTRPALDVEYEPRLVEAAVLAALGGRRDEPAFRAERDPLYEVLDAEAREAAFSALHACWFERLALDRPFRETLGERPEIVAHCDRYIVAAARTAGEESADLLVAPDRRPMVLVRVRPETVAGPDGLRRFLRHELLHIGDMLDPDFGYEPCLPPPARAGTPDDLLRDRYRVLWAAWVDGRLTRLGHVAPSVRAERRRDFERAFPEPGEGTPEAFERFFGAPTCTHRELLRFAEEGRWRP
jgi:hypothetical protein